MSLPETANSWIDRLSRGRCTTCNCVLSRDTWICARCYHRYSNILPKEDGWPLREKSIIESIIKRVWEFEASFELEKAIYHD